MLHSARLDGYLTLDPTQCRELGKSLSERYRTASPFQHIVIDDFLDPEVLRNVVADFPSTQEKAFFDRDQERLKFQFQPHEVASGLVRSLFAELNSQAFLGFLEELTGISGLIPDPYFEGGGLHETKRGGHLGIHADFNVHDRMRLERRLDSDLFYTAVEDGLSTLPKRTTNFQRRPGSEDKSDWQIRRHHFVNDWVPAKLQRIARRLIG